MTLVDLVNKREYDRAYHAAHRAERLTQMAARAAAHPGQRAEWGRMNPGMLRAQVARRTERRRADAEIRERENAAARAKYVSLRRSPEARFWSKVDKSGECWTWTGQCDGDGYGRFWLNGKGIPAHRAVLIVMGVIIPNGLYVCHRCDNPPCVRPEHLFIADQSTNVRDSIAKGRHRWSQ